MAGSRKRCEHAHDARLSLALFAEEQHVVPGEDRVDDLGDDGVVVADDAGEEILPVGKRAREVGADLLLDGP